MVIKCFMDGASVFFKANAYTRSNRNLKLVPFAARYTLISVGIMYVQCSLADREASLRSWSSLQREVSGVHELLTVLHDAASTQQAAVLTASENVLQADCNVAEGRSTLAASER